MVAVGAVLLSLVDLMIFNYHVLIPGIVPALVLMVVVGAPVAAMLVGYSTLIQQSSTDEYRGRVIGAIGAVGALASLVGTALGGLLGERLGVVLVLNFQAIGYLAAGSMVWLTLATQGGLRDGTRVSRLRSQQGDALE
jgi:MFS family permease